MRPTDNYPISESAFERDWNPITCGGDLLNYEDVASRPLGEVWTVVDGDNGDWIAEPGFRVVNKVGYLRTMRAWTQEEADAGLNAIWFENVECESVEDDEQVAP